MIKITFSLLLMSLALIATASTSYAQASTQDTWQNMMQPITAAVNRNQQQQQQAIEMQQLRQQQHNLKVQQKLDAVLSELKDANKPKSTPQSYGFQAKPLPIPSTSKKNPWLKKNPWENNTNPYSGNQYKPATTQTPPTEPTEQQQAQKKGSQNIYVPRSREPDKSKPLNIFR